MPGAEFDDKTVARNEYIARGAGGLLGAVVGGLIEYVSSIHESALGGAFGPVGTYVAAVMAPIAGAYTELKLSKEMRRRESRAVTMLEVAFETVQENLKEKRLARSDWMGTSDADRSTGEEILEGAVLAVEQEHEEKKVRSIGLLVGNLAFEKSLDRSYANQLLQAERGLTYRQLCLLALFADPKSYPLRSVSLEQLQGSSPVLGVLQEIWDLHRRIMVRQPGDTLVELLEIVPSKTVVGGLGEWIVSLSELKTKIPMSDIDRVAKYLAPGAHEA